MRWVPVFVLVAALAGCTATEAPAGPSEPAAYDADAVRSGLADLFAGDDPQPRDVEAGECFADRLLETATPEELREGGLVADDGGAPSELPTLPESLAGTVAEAQLSCIDVVDSSARALTSVRKGDLDGAAYADCLRAALPRDAQKAALVATLMGEWNDPAITALAEAQVTCVEEQD